MSGRSRSLAILFFVLATGCVQRTMTIKSDPPGALVFVNGQEIGRTPVTQEFLWYGDYGVVLRLDGYETLKTTAPIPAPPWQYIPLDLITDMMPLTDEHVLNYTMKPPPPDDPDGLIANAEQTQDMLQSSALTRTKTPTTRRATTQKSK